MAGIVDDELRTPIFSDFLKKEKITGEYLAKKLKEELEATEPKFFQHKGTIEVTAWPIRQRARQDAHKLLGHYPAEKKQIVGKEGGPIEILMDFSAADENEDE